MVLERTNVAGNLVVVACEYVVNPILMQSTILPRSSNCVNRADARGCNRNRLFNEAVPTPKGRG